MRRHCPPDTEFEIRYLAVWDRARSRSRSPLNIESSRVSGEETFLFLWNLNAIAGRFTHCTRAPVMKKIMNWVFGPHLCTHRLNWTMGKPHWPWPNSHSHSASFQLELSNGAVQSQTAVTAYISGKLLLVFAFAKSNSSNCSLFKWAVTGVWLTAVWLTAGELWRVTAIVGVKRCIQSSYPCVRDFIKSQLVSTSPAKGDNNKPAQARVHTWTDAEITLSAEIFFYKPWIPPFFFNFKSS